MKKALLSLFFLPFFSVLGQELSLQELIRICSKDSVQEIADLLKAKKWIFSGSDSVQFLGAKDYAWRFESRDPKDQRRSSLLVRTKDNKTSYLSYDFQESDSYVKLIQSIEKSDFKLDTNFVERGFETLRYANSAYYLDIKIQHLGLSLVGKPSYSYTCNIIKKYSPLDRRNGPQTLIKNNAISKFTLEDNKLHGPITLFYPDGTIFKTGNYKMDLEHGQFIEYDLSGNVTREYSMVDGLKDGLDKEYHNKILLRSTTYKMGEKYGPFEVRDVNRILLEKGNYKDNLKVGTWIELDGSNKAGVSYVEVSYLNNVPQRSISIGTYKDSGLNDISK